MSRRPPSSSSSFAFEEKNQETTTKHHHLLHLGKINKKMTISLLAHRHLLHLKKKTTTSQEGSPSPITLQKKKTKK